VGVLFGKPILVRTFISTRNRAWRANNPIPTSMDRWSRRWQAGEVNKEKLRTILEEAASKTDQPKGSITQLTGDFYAACMDMATIDKLGIKPLEPSLAAVDAIKDREGLLTMIGRMESVGINVPFGLGPPDPHNPSEAIASDQHFFIAWANFAAMRPGPKRTA